MRANKLQGNTVERLGLLPVDRVSSFGQHDKLGVPRFTASGRSSHSLVPTGLRKSRLPRFRYAYEREEILERVEQSTRRA